MKKEKPVLVNVLKAIYNIVTIGLIFSQAKTF